MMSLDYQVKDGKILRKNPDGSLVWVNLDPGPELTPDGTIHVPMGRPRIMAEAGGTHLLLYPKFRRWLRNPPKHLARWEAVIDRRKYFIRLAALAVLEPTESPEVERLRSHCMETEGTLTEAALRGILRPTVARLTVEDCLLATMNPSLQLVNTDGSVEEIKLTPRERQRRKRLREAAKMFDENCPV